MFQALLVLTNQNVCVSAISSELGRWFSLIIELGGLAQAESQLFFVLFFYFAPFFPSARTSVLKILLNEEIVIMSFQEMERNGQNDLTRSDLNESENPNYDVDISVELAFKSKVEGIVLVSLLSKCIFLFFHLVLYHI